MLHQDLILRAYRCVFQLLFGKLYVFYSSKVGIFVPRTMTRGRRGNIRAKTDDRETTTVGIHYSVLHLRDRLPGLCACHLLPDVHYREGSVWLRWSRHLEWRLHHHCGCSSSQR